MAVSGTIAMPLIIAPNMCIFNDEIGNVATANIISTLLVVAGTSTLLQTTLGVRLPILQGSSLSFLPPIFTILSLPQNQCPAPLPRSNDSNVTLYNDTDGMIVDGEELWQRRMREIQGAVLIASLLQVVLGATGLVGLLLKFVGPLTIMPTITLIGLDLFMTAANDASGQWGIAILTMFLLMLFSQYLVGVSVPIPAYSKRKGVHMKSSPIFQLFPVVFAIALAWILCLILTSVGAFPDTPGEYGYLARTDIRSGVIENTPWFRIPYPGQWGAPKPTIAGCIGMLAAIIAGILESIGDYYACARLSGAPNPPAHAINRGILIEGVGCVLAGAFGSTTGVTSYSGNVAAISISKVGSRSVMHIAGFILVLLGFVAKFGSIFVTLPSPVLGGIYFVIFGMISAVGIVSLRTVDMTSSRNVFIIGFTTFTGLSVANWMKANPGAIQTGIPDLDQVLYVLLSSAMLLGGMLGFILDNTLPGTLHERGIVINNNEEDKDNQNASDKCYSLPFPTNFKLSKYIPFMPPVQKKNDELKENIMRDTCV